MTKKSNVITKVLLRVKRYWFLLILSVLLAAVHVLTNLYIPVLVGFAIDHIIAAGQVDFQMVIHYLRQILICAAVGALSQWIMSQMNNRITYHVTRDIRNEAFSHIQQLPLSYLDSHPHGDLVSRVIADVDTFADGLLMGFTQFFTGILTILGTLLFMLRISLPIALVVVCITPLSLLVARFIAQRTHSMFKQQSTTRG